MPLGGAGDRAKGCVLASDAFFPFKDGLEQAANSGASSIVQPGGSIRDQEVIDAADESGSFDVVYRTSSVQTLRVEAIKAKPSLHSTWQQRHYALPAPDNPLKCAILISGSGSGMEAMLRHQQETACLHTTSVVISNKSDVLGIERAKTLNTPTVVIELPQISEGDARRLSHEGAIETVCTIIQLNW